MKYLIVGAGGVGGAIGGFLAAAGKDVELILRGENLEAVREHGLKLHSDLIGEKILPVAAFSTQDYSGSPDVVFVCVKGYSLDGVLPFLQKISHPGMIVVPILNIYGTGEALAEHLPHLTVADGCIYIVSYLSGKGEVTQAGTIFRIVFGMPDGKNPAVFDQIKKDLTESGIGAVVSDNIRRDCLQKLACVSPMAATGAFYDATMGEIRSDPEMRGVYARLIGEISALADAMGLSFAVDVVAENLKILDNVTPDTTASMQKDLKRGSQTEMDGLIFEIVRLGKQYGVATPEYERIARHFGMKQ